MQPFTTHTGTVVPLDRSNVDTDQLVPKQFLKRIERTGFGPILFFAWRFDEAGNPLPSFPLNQPQYQGASILIAGPNFGSGSSREHAVWALQEYGFRVIIAPSFADIFASNAGKNGLLLITLPAEQWQGLMTKAASPGYQLTADLINCCLTDSEGLSLPFQVDESRRQKLLQGLDEIALTLRHVEKIQAFEERMATR
ncbi:MAG TPA: 3-isopropylmalate dehydratase small subunit [Symbiobacteriaceae bacterium]|nr:3-isopropylmalate dehydratase small subunit [Symbiobacteriaceae bacterium]